MKDYYKLLGVSSAANDAEIKSAFRKLVVIYHPDKNPSEEAARVIVEINEAYEVLSDPEKKTIYDQLIDGRNPIQAQPIHRDPAYRRRPPNPNFKSKKQQTLEMMQEYLPITSFISRIAFALFLFIALDFLLPTNTQQETIVKMAVPKTGRYQSSNKKFYTNKGTGFEVTNEVSRKLDLGMAIEVTYSSLVHIPTYLKIEQTSTVIKVATSIYGSFIFVPLILMVTSILGSFYKRDVEFDFNMGVTNFLVVIFTLLFLFIHKLV